MIYFLTLEQILRLHDEAVKKFGGLRGVRDQNLLLSCIESPKQCVFGEELCPTIYDKAAAYLFLRVNKVRIAFESCFEDETLEDFVVKLAHSKKLTREDAAYFLEFGEEMN